MVGRNASFLKKNSFMHNDFDAIAAPAICVETISLWQFDLMPSPFRHRLFFLLDFSQISCGRLVVPAVDLI